MSTEGVVDLVRRWATDWLEAADPAACDGLLADDYSLAISGVVLGGPDGGGRDGYVRATVDGLLHPVPGATLTVHDLVASTEGRAAGLMTWSGTTPDGRAATWRVVATFRAEDGQLVGSHCEEDYLARRRQIKAGTTDPVPPALPDPWDVRPVPSDPVAEDAVRAWLAAGDLDGVVLDDGAHSDGRRGLRGATGGPPSAGGAGGAAIGRPADEAAPPADPAIDPRLDDVAPEILDCFSAGPRVAFHAHLHGRLRPSPADDDGAGSPPAPGTAGAGATDHDDRGSKVVLPVAGLVTVEDGAVVGGHVVRDRLGLHRALHTRLKESA